MKYLFLSKKSLVLFLIPFIFSCTPKKDILYYQNIETMAQEKLNSYEIRIQPDDLLKINISAEAIEKLSLSNKEAVIEILAKHVGNIKPY